MQLTDLDFNKTYSYADYLLWKLQERVELIKGRVFKMSPAPSMQHQRVSQRLNKLLLVKLEEKQCEAFTAPFDVRLPKKETSDEKTYTVVQPDLCVICDKSKLDARGCVGAPDLVIEILSPGNSKKEMKEKFEVYEESGVREYWLVNLFDKNVICYILKDGKYYGLPPFVEDDIMTSTIFPDLKIDLMATFKES